MLKVAILREPTPNLLKFKKHLSELGVGSVAEFSNSGTRAPINKTYILFTRVKSDVVWIYALD